MIGGIEEGTSVSRWPRIAAAAVLLVGCALLNSVTAEAQQTAPPAGQVQQNAPPPIATPNSSPGVLKSIGDWFQGALDRFRSGVARAGGTIDRVRDQAGGAAKEAAGAAKGAADAAKDVAKGAADAAKGVAKQATAVAAGAAEQAADTMKRLPTLRMVEGHELCEIAPNGAPDCRVAAATICKRHGFASGSSVDIQSAQKCSARVWLSGRTPDPGECETQSFVNRAVCQ